MNNNENAKEAAVYYFTNRLNAERFARSQGGPINIDIAPMGRGNWKVTISPK